jgi:tRNA (guanine37-N1)-methyltransferase
VSLAALDKSQFNSTVATFAVEVPAKQCNELKKLLTTVLLRQRLQKGIVDSPTAVDAANRPLKRVLLDPTFKSPAELPDAARNYVEAHGLAVVPHTLDVTYENMSAEQVLRAVLPAGVEVPSSFESVGHLAHFNLRTSQVPYRFLIGQVFLDKSNAQITTIVNKSGSIETEFRTFPMEVIAGKPTTTVSVAESGARFVFDYATVYWNSRLQHEHQRLISAFL